jgi:molybdopterin-containing oxidoreductase family iron-sulfur binding subunit
MDRDRPDPPSRFNRRSLLQAMAASLALAGAGGKRADADERALPYVNAPEFVVPGKARWYATSVGFAGYAHPALGKTYVGRPVKLEGNAEHPATRGATDAFLQAALLGLYDPERSQAPRHLRESATWSALDTAIAERRAVVESRQGEGFRLLTGAVTSPTLIRQIDALLQRWPKAQWHVWEPFDDEPRLLATERILGRRLQPHFRLDRADLVVSLDDDFLGPGPRQAVQAHLWAERRMAFQAGQGAARLLVAEPSLSATGTMAENRLICSPLAIPRLAHGIAHALDVVSDRPPGLTDRESQWIEHVAAALRRHNGRAVLTAGAQHAADVQALALLVNEKIGSFGATLIFTDPIVAVPPADRHDVGALAEDMAAGGVSTLVVLDGNPAYATPTTLGFAEAMEKVEFRLHGGLYLDETARRCHWHAPLQHDLESWSDGRAVDGTAAIIQPLVRPFYDVRSIHVVLDRWLGGTGSDHDIVRATWSAAWKDDFADKWQDAVVHGFVPESAFPPVAATVAERNMASAVRPNAQGLVVELRPDASIWDGRFAQNAWLQETPRPISKVTWGNVILVSPQLARAHGIESGEEVRVEAGGRTIVGPAWFAPGQEADTVTVTSGYGRERAGLLTQQFGYDAFSFWDADLRMPAVGATIARTGNRLTIASTQPYQAMDGFDFVRSVELPETAVKKKEEKESFYPERQWDSPSWGMSIDVDLCIGCNACHVACVAENNVPMVGKELVSEGREMHWLRIDHYHEGDPAEPKSYFQPVPCMHCEQAPCEMGCPVNATVHSHDGLNVQVYNRCVGTRTCSAYCPYKVRRFNWFEYTGSDPDSIRAMRNPEVTVRSRGVMEKCTYCVQRISAARIAAKIAGRPIADGEVVTACQQACPTQAIVFGDVVDPNTAVSRRKAGSRDYSLLEEANTRPRTTYLARIEKGERK